MLDFSAFTSTSILSFALLVAACNPSSADTDSGDGGSTSAGSASDGSASSGAPTTGQAGDCGNDVLEAGEECDGAELGGKQCADVDPAYIGGTLACGASCTFDASGCMVAPDQALVVLNEVTSKPVASGTYAGPHDAIELHNAGGKAADLSGWKLSDDATFPDLRTYVFPNGSTLAPGEYKVLVSVDPMTMTGDYPFGVSDNTVETLTLADAGGTEVDSVVVDGYKAQVSYCRIPDGLGAWEQCEQTFGAANQLAATACGNGKLEAPELCDTADLGGQTCQGLALGFSGGALACSPKCTFDTAGCTTASTLVINELESTADNIELFNGGGAPVDLSGYILTDDKIDADYDPMIDTAELVFAPGTSIAAKAYLVIQPGMLAGQHPFGLGLNGDTVSLLKPDLTVVDQVTYGPSQAAVSYCRKPNGPGGTWTPDCVPTMGSQN